MRHLSTKKERLSSCEFDTETVKINQDAKYLGERSFEFVRPVSKIGVFMPPFLGHLLRDDLINLVKMSVRPSVRPYVRPSFRRSTINHNAATNQIVEFVRVDETFTTI